MANNQTGNEAQVPMKIDSGDSSSAASDPFGVFTANGMKKLDEKSDVYGNVKAFFLQGMGSAGPDTEIVAVHKSVYSDPVMDARYKSFKMFEGFVAQNRGGNPIIRDGWYGGSKAEILEILVHGFSGKRMAAIPNEKSYGLGLHLNAPKFASDGVLWSTSDENGLRHILLCRMTLGKMEKIGPGSVQSGPRSKEVDSGVDDFKNPRRYIVWNAYMNSHVLPMYVVSFKASQGVHVQPVQEIASGV